jgi:sec-independent protein translocase protein TatC
MRDQDRGVTPSPSGMRFVDHLEELRRRIIVAAIAFAVAAAGCFALSDRILGLLLLPSGGLELRAFGLMDGFLIKLRIAVYAGIVVSIPVWGYQLLRFVGPALVPNEKKRVAPFLAATVALFAGGTAFGYWLLGTMIGVLTKLFPPQIQYLPSASDYLSFVVFFLLACGMAFELPCVLLLLVSLRVLSAEFLRRRRRLAWFALFAFAELITPVTDPIVAPLTVMVPLLVLYEASVLVARRMESRREAAEASAAAGAGS